MPKPTLPLSANASPFDVLTARRNTIREQPDSQTGGVTAQPEGQTVSHSDQLDSRMSEPPDDQTSNYIKHLPDSSNRGGKRSDPGFQKFTVYIPKKTHRAAKAIANLQGRELSEIVANLLQTYVREQQADALKSL